MSTRLPGLLGKRLAECDTLLQVALDVVSMRDALNIGYNSLVSPSVILEAGTPLIKEVGLETARLLLALPQNPIVVADTKTFDTGELEVALAANNGFHAASVLALAPDETIIEAVKAANSHNIALYGDLIGHPDPLKGAERLEQLGVHVALLHIGIDVQRKLGITASQIIDLISKISKVFEGPIAVAGGIKPSETGRLAKAGANIIIIGSAITKSSDPRKAAEEAVRNMRPGCI